MMRMLSAIALVIGSGSLIAADFPTPLPVETTGKSETLPAVYPKEWVLLHDVNFFSLVDGKMVVVDVSDTTSPYKGMIGAGQMASLLQGTAQPELYVAETFYSRRTRGERTDAITIYDTKTLAYKDEIILPGGKRGQFVTQKNSFQFTDGERLGLVFNFTPAASVTVVDLQARKVLSEIQIPGCSLMYPTGKRGFSTLCGNGTLATFNLDEQGKEAGRSTTAAFNDIDKDPLFMKTAIIDGVTHLVSFKGRVQPLDLTGEKAVVNQAWSLVDEADQKDNWRPGGWQVLTADKNSHLYVLMQKDGHEGTHKNGGEEVWVFDAKKMRRLERFKLTNPGVSIEVTQGKKPYLVVLNAAMEVDVYDFDSRTLLQTIGGRAAETPFVMHAAH
ncbi:MAG: amine dehydrogenase large subunit [Panacagrimonas sp.]